MTPDPSISVAPRWSGVSRYRAAATHLGISALIGAATLALMLIYWYPSPLFEAMGGKELIVLIVGVDVCIGPLITLVIFNPRKKELLFDLAVVVILQLAALSYGIYAMGAGRPVFVVFAVDRFVVVTAAELEPDAIAKAVRPEFRTLPLTGPVRVATDMPSEANERNDLAFAGLAGLGVQNQPKYFVPYAERRAQVLARAVPLNISAQTPADAVDEIDRVLAAGSHGREHVLFLAAATKRSRLTALIDGGTGDVIGLAAVDPLTLSVAPPKAH
jgi:hypothetical protein